MSDELAFIPAPDGSLNYWQLDDASATILKVAAGPVRLQQGRPLKKGFGLLHVEENAARMKQIKALGYKGVREFVSHICANWCHIRDGSKGRLLLCAVEPGFEFSIVLQKHQGTKGPFWTVVSAVISRSRNEEILLSR